MIDFIFHKIIIYLYINVLLSPPESNSKIDQFFEGGFGDKKENKNYKAYEKPYFK